ncbi:N-acetylglucosamine kinase [Actinomadura craniellae]|uniref:N-acetylglucosamine kinase n=1 Tax=Actinomadura craniellae TaxID=2231787 RepID=UPI0026BE995C|nr:BadF/BadG/BcrA/BcrD ATPase family protein [Actinomadura craniellae]
MVKVYGHHVLTHLAGPYVIGIDAGGTKTRCTVLTLGGAVAGSGTGPGANPNSGGDTSGALTMALRSAIGDLDRSLILNGVFGIAGAGSAGRPAAVAAARQAWHAVGLRGSPAVVTDIAVAFAAGSQEPAGIVVFSGTGAGAAVIRDGVIVQRADGYGPLVGDEGSAVWLGKEAVRATLAAVDGRGEPTLLTESVPRALLGPATPRVPLPRRVPALVGAAGNDPGEPPPPAIPVAQAIIKEVHGRPLADLGKLGPVVCAAATAGDPVARRITDEAAHSLLRSVDAVRPALDGRPAPVVTAGSVLGSGPVADAVRAGLCERFGAPPRPAGDGAIGAAGIALRRLGLVSPR